MDRLKQNSKRVRTVYQHDLHSNMDRLKPEPVQNIIIAVGHLHSNMDRLKHVGVLQMAPWHYIYIPIWID